MMLVDLTPNGIRTAVVAVISFTQQLAGVIIAGRKKKLH